MSSRNRQSASVARGRAAPATQVPLYEPPANPLTPAAQNALNNLKRAHTLAGLEKHLKDANVHLSESAYELNLMLANRKMRVEKDRKKANDAGEEIDVQAERGLEERIKLVNSKNVSFEKAVRKAIDEQQIIQDMKDALDVTARTAANAATQAASQAQSFDPTLPGASAQHSPPPSEIFNQKNRSAEIQYQNLSLEARYRHHPDYINFKQQVHEGIHGDDVPLPNASTWFAREQGSPAPGTIRGTGGDDSDDDIMIARETISTKCPLTLKELEDPIMSMECRHTFEKSAIMEMLTGRPGGMQCPVPGCSKMLSKARLRSDDALLRKIQRLQKKRLAAQNADDDSDMEDAPRDGLDGNTSILLDASSPRGNDGFDDLLDDEEVVPSTAKIEPRSSRPPPSSRRSTVLDLGDEDEDDEDEDEDMEDD